MRIKNQGNQAKINKNQEFGYGIGDELLYYYSYVIRINTAEIINNRQL